MAMRAAGRERRGRRAPGGRRPAAAPVGDEGVFDALGAEARSPAPARGGRRRRRGSRRRSRRWRGCRRSAPGLGEAGGAAAGLQVEEVDEGEGEGGLAGEVAAHVGLVHRGDRVAGHGRVAVEAVDRAVAGAGEEGAEGLPAADLRGGDDEGGEGGPGRSAARASSVATPIEPMCGALSRVEQSL